MTSSEDIKSSPAGIIRTIGIRGTHPGCGKDTVADMLANKLATSGRLVKPGKFATPLRECVAILTGVSVAESETVEGKNRFLPDFGRTVGQFLQHFGTDVVRSHVGNDNVWVNALMRRYQKDDFVIVSDVRFDNEQSAVKARDGVILLVSSTRQTDSRQMAGRSNKHASERGLDGILADHEIRNDGSLDDLSTEVDAFIARYLPAQGAT